MMDINDWTLIWDAIRSTFGAYSSHLSGTCVGKRQTKSNQKRKASVESRPPPSSRAGRDASGGKQPQLWMPLFSLSQMGANSSRIKLLYIFKILEQVLYPEF